MSNDSIHTIYETGCGDSLQYDPSDQTYRIVYFPHDLATSWLTFGEVCELLEAAKFHHVSRNLK